MSLEHKVTFPACPSFLQSIIFSMDNAKVQLTQLACRGESPIFPFSSWISPAQFLRIIFWLTFTLNPLSTLPSTLHPVRSLFHEVKCSRRCIMNRKFCIPSWKKCKLISETISTDWSKSKVKGYRLHFLCLHDEILCEGKYGGYKENIRVPWIEWGDGVTGRAREDKSLAMVW